MKGFVPTPTALVDLMCEKLFSHGRPTRAQRLLDPGCGTGVFLEGVLRWCRRRHATPPRCTGVELNPSLVGVARRSLSGARVVQVVHADFLGRLQGKFDYVLGNPPYVSIGGLTEKQKHRFRRRFRAARARFDLYLLFMERALASLSPGGRLVFITPEKFTYVATAAPLRRLLAEMQVEEIHLFDENAFEGLITYPAITTVRNIAPGAQTRVLFRDGSRRTVALPADGRSWLPAMNGRPCITSPWTLDGICKRVSCGVATGADSVFVVRDTQVPLDLRPFALPTIAGRHLLRADRLARHSGWSMLIPYRCDGSLMEEAELGPLGAFLREAGRRARLLGRTCVARKPWYAFHENPPLRDILRPKILCKDIGEEPRFVVDEDGTLVPRHSAYYIVPHDAARVHELAEYLNSAHAKAWLRDHCQRAANGFLRLQSHVLKALPVPERFAAPPPSITRRASSDPSSIRLDATR